MAYPAMLKFLPAGFMGLMIAGLLAAYVSTLSTHLNWGTSYLVHDFYRRFMRPGRPERHYIRIGRAVTVALMVLAGWVTTQLDSAKFAFDLLLSIGAGTGLIYLLRWFWWRVNAWAEIAAMVASFLLAVGFYVARHRGLEWGSHYTLVISIAVTTVIWIAVAFLTPQTAPETLARFYALIRPGGPGWKAIRAATGLPGSSDNLPAGMLAALLGAIAIWSALFATGCFLYGQSTRGVVLTAIAVATGIGCIRLLAKMLKAG
jgi:Na+/proline symporter